MPIHAIVEHSSFSAEGSILSSLATTVVIQVGAAWQFEKTDY
jgi:hypothetical protein